MKALQSPRVRLQVNPLISCSARATIKVVSGAPESCLITVDPSQVGYITGTIHELIHFVLYDELTRWGDLAEILVEALETHLYDRLRLRKSVPAHDRWREAIHAKLSS